MIEPRRDGARVMSNSSLGRQAFCRHPARSQINIINVTAIVRDAIQHVMNVRETRKVSATLNAIRTKSTGGSIDQTLRGELYTIGYDCGAPASVSQPSRPQS